MKKWLSYVLILSLLLACVGCSKQDSETATDLSSVATQKANASVEEESSAPKKQEESKPIQSLPVESIPTESEPVESVPSQPEESTQEDPVEKEQDVSVILWEGENDFDREIGWKEPMPPKFVVCCSVEELNQYLSDYQLSVPWAGEYTKEYFKTNQLILYWVYMKVFVVEKATLSRTVLSVHLKEPYSITSDVMYEFLYPMEIHHTLKDVETVDFYIQGYDNNGKKTEFHETYTVE